MRVSKEGGHVPRILVGQIRFAKAPTVTVLVRNENRTLGESEALLEYGADIYLEDLNFLKTVGLRKKYLKKSLKVSGS